MCQKRVSLYSTITRVTWSSDHPFPSAIGVGVYVGVGVAVSVGVDVGLGVLVVVGLGVGVGVTVGVEVTVGVDVDVGVDVEIGVSDGTVVTTTTWMGVAALSAHATSNVTNKAVNTAKKEILDIPVPSTFRPMVTGCLTARFEQRVTHLPRHPPTSQRCLGMGGQPPH
jgi:hypothetical protein